MTTRSASAYRGWEKRRENAEWVTMNLPADLLPLWDRIHGQFKGTPIQREEAFLRYAGEHGTEIEQAINDEAELKLAREIAAYHGRSEESAVPWDDASVVFEDGEDDGVDQAPPQVDVMAYLRARRFDPRVQKVIKAVRGQSVTGYMTDEGLVINCGTEEIIVRMAA